MVGGMIERSMSRSVPRIGFLYDVVSSFLQPQAASMS